LRAIISEAGLDLKVVVITGDDLLNDLDRLEAMNASEMFSGEAFPPKEKIASANAYIGAFPIATALAAGADIVVTGRCVDSAVTLGACIHEFGWSADDLDKLASGSAVGHLIECGPQATGGNFTDWEQVADSLYEVGYPIAEVWEDGTADIYKPANTGGLVNRGTVAEQLLYEIGDPAAYMLPDVICDFTQIQLEQVAPDRVRMTHARGRGVPETYKTSMTWADGWRAGSTFWY
ncbi:MAG: acyclic terpene utilization AtuA family protein, partial [Halieaceae bacterium]